MPFKPGQSGNPAGKPIGTVSILPEFKNKSLKQICKELSISVAMPQVKKHAETGNMQACELLLAYGFGKPVQQVHQVNVNMDYSNWTDAQIEAFEETGEMPMLQEGQEPGSKPDKDKEVKI